MVGYSRLPWEEDRGLKIEDIAVGASLSSTFNPLSSSLARTFPDFSVDGLPATKLS
jgi:hypothetical protein